MEGNFGILVSTAMMTKGGLDFRFCIFVVLFAAKGLVGASRRRLGIFIGWLSYALQNQLFSFLFFFFFFPLVCVCVCAALIMTDIIFFFLILEFLKC